VEIKSGLTGAVNVRIQYTLMHDECTKMLLTHHHAMHMHLHLLYVYTTRTWPKVASQPAYERTSQFVTR
jgi:hypothetical protein